MSTSALDIPDKDELVELRLLRTKSLSCDAGILEGFDSDSDGDGAAWCTLLGGWLTFVATFGYTTSYGVYQDLYTSVYGMSSSRASWIGSTQLCFVLLGALPAGKLLDLGYFRQTNLFGSILFVFSLFMLSLADPRSYYQVFLSQGLGAGLGVGLLYVPALAVQAHHWRRRRTLAMGITISGACIGGIIFPIMLNQLLFHRRVSFAWTVRESAFVVLGLLVVANLLMRDRKGITQNALPKPNLKTLLTDPPYVITIIGVAILNWGLYFPYFYLQVFALNRGVNANISFYMLALLNGASIPGRIIPGAFTPKLGVYNTFVFSMAVCSILAFAMLRIESTSGVIIFAALYGFFSGTTVSLVTPVVSLMSKHEGEIGTRLGLGFCLASMGVLTGNPIDGALLGIILPYNWSRAIAFSGVMMLIGTCIAFVARLLLAKRKETQFI
ncbi:MFS general substrate transporter [Peniophora sp. CONT]|nr:MFS general substrate transporter [Peniophora sp. CONT]